MKAENIAVKINDRNCIFIQHQLVPALLEFGSTLKCKHEHRIWRKIPTIRMVITFQNPAGTTGDLFWRVISINSNVDHGVERWIVAPSEIPD